MSALCSMALGSLLALAAQVPSKPVVDGATRSAAEGHVQLWGDYALADPWFLLLLPLGCAVWWWGRTRRGRDAGRVPALPSARPPRSWMQRIAFIGTLLEFSAIALVALALARPLRGKVETNTRSEGVDIVLLIDRSGSMRHKDLDPNRTRLEVIKAVVKDFAVRRMTDRQGNADNVALITFAAYPLLLCPFTLDVDAITGFLAGLEPIPAENRGEDGTAIGVGLAKAVGVLKSSDAKSKIVVLLTDGENNIDLITPADAAKLAADAGVKVYTVFAGRYEYTMDFLGNTQPSSREIDTSELVSIAKATGGRFYRARDAAELEKIYAEIEALERTPRVEQRYHESFDLYPRFLAAALSMYVAAWFFQSTVGRRLA